MKVEKRWLVAGAVVCASLAAAQVEAPAEDAGVVDESVSVDAGVEEGATPTLDALDAGVAVDAADAGTPSVRQTVVRGRSQAQAQRESAEAVKVVETKQAKTESADLGEVMARAPGVSVRRSGGLGSGTRFSLNGLSDDQVRFFLDEMPLAFSGYPFRISNVPVNLVQQIEVFSGVVPIRLGADALGGAVNIVTPPLRAGTHASASYEFGSFSTHRLTAGVQYLNPESGFFVRGNGFFDVARNDYLVDVEVVDEKGRVSPAKLPRFHDGYRAGGGGLELGVVNRSWAKKLVVRGFGTGAFNQLQSNIVMTVPYGDATFEERTGGATARYENDVGPVEVKLLAGYSFTRSNLYDVGTCLYDWYGRCVLTRSRPGEIDYLPHDVLTWTHGAFGRLNANWRVSDGHEVHLSVAPTYEQRTGDERAQLNPDARDPLNAIRSMYSQVNALEYELKGFDQRLQNQLFLKHYWQRVQAIEIRPDDTLRDRSRDSHSFGVGDGLRFAIADGLVAKASYEWATRLPAPEEIFGDNTFVLANLGLVPERSHNFNLGFVTTSVPTPAGGFRAEVQGFARLAEQLIVLLGNDFSQTYNNLGGGRSLGVEATAGWTSPGGYLTLDQNVTWQDFRNTSNEGVFADMAGDRIPARPWLFANTSALLRFRNVLFDGDDVTASWHSRYVHSFFRSWESLGRADTKQQIPSQFVHSLALGYGLRGSLGFVSFTIEAQNLTDARVFDFWGVQRPGRAFFSKVVVEL